MKKERLAIIDGIRTPFCKSGGPLKEYQADHLAIHTLNHLLDKLSIERSLIDEVILGNVAQPANAANISRVVSLKAGLSPSIPAYTVQRNCASGMESISTAYNKIFSNQAEIIIAGGTESMSNIPFLFNNHMKEYLELFMRCKTAKQKVSHLLKFKLKFLKPVIGLLEGLTDPTCGLVMGLTAENLAKEFTINRQAQDEYALKSHQKAVKAIKSKKFTEEICPIPIKTNYKAFQETDDGPREDQSIAALTKLRPYFDRKTGTVTVGNACPITDGAAMTLVMKESKAKELKLKPLGFIKDYAYAGLQPERMGLGPVFATSKLLEKTNEKIQNIDLIEMNEAFAVQILANLKAFGSKSFAKENLNKSEAVGEIDPKRVNVNGGAIALGHPVGTSGTRIVITLLKELQRQKKHKGIANICIGGGQGGAFLLERE